MISKIKSGIAALALLFASSAFAANQAPITMPIVGPMTAATFANTYLNPGMLALFTCNIGSTAPANGAGAAPQQGQCWWDTSASPLFTLRYYDGSNFVSAGTLDISGHAFTTNTSIGSDSVTTTTYTMVDADRGRVKEFCNASGVAVSLPRSNFSGSFLTGWNAGIRNCPTGGAVVITPATSTIDGNTTKTISANQSLQMWSDTSNYQTDYVFLAPLNNLSDIANAATARTNLGVQIGLNVEAWDNDLDCIAALATTGIIKRTGAGTCSAGAASASDLTNGVTGSGLVVLATSPTLAGVPLSTTPATNDSSTKIATTAYYTGQAATATPNIDGTGAVGTSLLFARQDHVHPTDTTRLAVANNLSDVNSKPTSRVNLGLDQFTGHGDSVYTILATDRVVATNAALTASRAWTLPAASAFSPGQQVTVADFFGTVTGTHTLVITRAGADTINGGTTATISVANGAYLLISDGVSKWTAQALGAAAGGGVSSITCGTGLSGGTITTSGTCALALDSNVLEVDSGLGTTITNNTMMGWGVTSCRVTPKYSTRLHIEVAGNVGSLSGTATTVTLRWGTGTGPAQGASSASGSAIGSTPSPNANGTNSVTAPFTIGGIVTGLTVGTAVWIDVAVNNGTGVVDASISQASCRAFEIM